MGPINNNSIMVDEKQSDGSEISTNNIIPVTMKDLDDAQKQFVEMAMEEYKRACLLSFSTTNKGKFILTGT